MNRLTLFTDISGRLSLSVAGSSRVTATAVVLETARTAEIATRLPARLPKWRDCNLSIAKEVVEFLCADAVAIGVFSVNKDTPAWRQFWIDVEPLQAGILAQDRRPAGFVKPATVLGFHMIMSAAAVGTGHALRMSPKNRIQDYRGRDLIERTIVSDSDFAGDETIDVYRGLWNRADGAQPRLEAAGFRLTTAEVRVTTEQAEPLLLLPDYAAGIAHAALMDDPGSIPLPLQPAEARALLTRMHECGKLAIVNTAFESTYAEIFGPELMSAAQDWSASQKR